jgi:hypothetical protein
MGPLILIAALLACEVTADAPAFQVDTIDGRSTVGVLKELNGNELVLKTSTGEQNFKLSEVQFVGTSEKPNRFPSAVSTVPGKSKLSAPGVVVETLDGTRLSGSDVLVVKGAAKLKLASGETLKIPEKSIHRIEFQLDGKAVAWPELPKDVTSDLIIVRTHDGADIVEGIAGAVRPGAVVFTVDGDAVVVNRAKVMGIVYYHPERSVAPAEAAVIAENKAGSKISAARVAVFDGQLQITTTFGATLTWPLASVRSIDFSPSRLVYLSDLQPDAAQWNSWLDFGGFNAKVADFYRPRFDSSRDGGTLSIGGKAYHKGVALIPRTVLEYKIAGRGQTFRATVGIDDSVHGAGSVRLVVEGDGQNLYSGKITGRDKPVDLNLNVANVKRLRIIADFGGEADVGDYLDLGGARIVK